MQEKWDRETPTLKHTYTPFRAVYTFFQTLDTLPTHLNHNLHVTGLCFCVKIAQTRLVKVQNTQQGTSGWGQKRNMVHITSLFQTTSRRLPLWLLYPPHPPSFPKLHSFPSNSTPPLSLPFTPNTSPTEVETSGKPFDELFCFIFPLF